MMTEPIFLTCLMVLKRLLSCFISCCELWLLEAVALPGGALPQ